MVRSFQTLFIEKQKINTQMEEFESHQFISAIRNDYPEQKTKEELEKKGVNTEWKLC